MGTISAGRKVKVYYNVRSKVTRQIQDMQVDQMQ